MARLTTQQRVSLTILVAALGYFVDVFDIQLFTIVRIASLKSLGLTADEITTIGAQLLNWQMAGMLAGGILWGILGDKKGRIWVLFGTILLYSLANIANAFATNIPEYAAARFFSGLGLAGEIGAGVTLASELLPKNIRTYGTTIVIGVGVMGPIVATYVADVFDWRMAFVAGGVLGLLLLAFRVSVNESGMFTAMKKDTDIPRGHFFMLFNNRKRFLRYLGCIAIGSPNWFALGILVFLAPEIGKSLGAPTAVSAATAIMSFFIGSTFGNLTSGVLSQIIRSRKKVQAICLVGNAISSFVLIHVPGMSAAGLYGLIMLNGLFTIWGMFITTTPEQFGTNLRATAATTAPNFVRGCIILYSFLIGVLKPSFGFLESVQIVGILCFSVAAIALWYLPETFGRDLDFVER